MHIFHTNCNTGYVLKTDAVWMRALLHSGSQKLRPLTIHSALLVLMLFISPFALAQERENGQETALEKERECPQWPEPPVFVAEVMAELDRLQPHELRWNQPQRWQELTHELAALRLDGLHPGYYRLSEILLIAGRQSDAYPPDRCHAWLASQMLAWSVKDLAMGRLDPETLGLVWHQRPHQPEPQAFAQALNQAFHSPDGLAIAFRNARPTLPAYHNLRRAYSQRLELLALQWPQVAPGPTLRIGDHGERVEQLARRLIAQGYLNGNMPWPGGPDSDLQKVRAFDAALETAVADFQRDHGLTPDGLVGNRSRTALNMPPAAWTARVRANLERMRWFAPYLQSDQLLVDIAGARVILFRDGERIWEGRAQVGRAERKTPALTSTVSHVTVNPTWTIPPTIFYEDTLPAIRSDPDYLERNRLTVIDRTGTPLDPAQVDWSRPGSIMLRQASGPGNALGQVAIRFPNPFSVYLHDTPSQRLFGTPERFYSSGCVRVENAVSLTDQLFPDANTSAFQRLHQARSGEDTRNVSLATGVPLIMAYWTAQADDDGRLQFRRDTYEEDELLIDLLDADALLYP